MPHQSVEGASSDMRKPVPFLIFLFCLCLISWRLLAPPVTSRVEQYLISADNLMDDGSYKLAYARYRRALTLDSTNEKAQKGLFKSSIHKVIAEDHGGSISTWEIETRLRANQDDPHNHLLLGDLAQRSKQFDNALGHYKTAVALHPNYAHGWFKLGKLYQQQGRLNSSMSMYGNALSLAPAHYCYLSALASAFEEKGQHQEAIELRKTVVKLNRNLLGNILNLALAFRSSGDLERAIHYYALLVNNLKNEKIFLIRENRPPWTFEIAEQRLLLDDVQSISSYIHSSYLLTKFLAHPLHSALTLPTIPDSRIHLLLSNDIAQLKEARPELTERLALFMGKSDFPVLYRSSSVNVATSGKLTFNPVKTPECE